MIERLLKHLSIQKKQSLIILLTCSVALLLACGAFLGYDAANARVELGDGISVLADAIGNNCAAAIDFNDPKSAEETLAALRANDNVVSACVYALSGRVFATYQRDPSPQIVPPTALPVSQEKFTDQQFQLFRPIKQRGERIGSIYVASDLHDLSARRKRYLTIVGLVSAGALLVAFILSARLQRLIFGPIQRLLQMTRSVAQEKNYSVRATRQSNDELGQLVDGFNEMLTQIQARDVDLQTARDNLERRVEERTHELAESVSLLNATLESTADGIVAFDLADKILSYNTKFTAIWQFPAAMLERRDSTEMKLFSAGKVKDPEIFTQRINAKSTTSKTENFDVVELLDGRTFERYVFPQLISGRCEGTVVNYRDVTEQRRAEAELRWNSAFLTAQITSAVDGMLVVNGSGKKIFQNQRLAELWKIPQEIAEDPDDSRQIQFVISRTKNPAQFAERVTSLYSHPEEISHDEIELVDDTVMDRYSYPVTGLDGVRFGRIWVFRDITERKHGEAALQESKLFLQSTLDALSAHIAILDENGTILAVNRAWNRFACENSSLENRSGVGANYLNICDSASGTSAEEASPAAAGIRAVISGEVKEFQLEYPCQSPTEALWFILRVTRFGNSGGKHVVVAHENITKRKRAEQTVRESEEKFRQLADNITDVFWMTSPDLKKILYVSPGYERIWGRSAASLYADPHQWIESVLPDDHARVAAIFGSLVASERTVSAEYRIARPDGAIRWVHDRGFQVRDTAGQLVRLTGIVSDITERKQIETQLFQSQKMETVGKMAGGIAHEFNSIMTAIMGQSELLLNDLSSGNPLRKHATEISLCADRAATLTRQLLAFGRKQLLRPEILDLNKVLANMESVLGHMLNPRVKIVIVPALGLKKIKADVGQIEQVIVNISINAEDAMPEGGQLTLETANITLQEDDISAFPEMKPGDYVVLTITDTGIGMVEAVKQRIFEPFFSTKEVGEGTGLGLATCHGIIRQSGGYITLRSEPGHGTAFQIYLPQVEVDAAPVSDRSAPAHLPVGSETILLVESDPALREMAGNLLRRLGYHVLAVTTGSEALKLAAQSGNEQIDLLFTNVAMPEMNGRELARQLQAAHPETRLLFTSAYTEYDVDLEGARVGDSNLLHKPFTPSALARKVREVLDS